jgi:hypothetical protein
MAKPASNTISTPLPPKGWSPKGATIKAAMVGYRTGSTHGHADHAAALIVDARAHGLPRACRASGRGGIQRKQCD